MILCVFAFSRRRYANLARGIFQRRNAFIRNILGGLINDLRHLTVVSGATPCKIHAKNDSPENDINDEPTLYSDPILEEESRL